MNNLQALIQATHADEAANKDLFDAIMSDGECEHGDDAPHSASVGEEACTKRRGKRMAAKKAFDLLKKTVLGGKKEDKTEDGDAKETDTYMPIPDATSVSTEVSTTA